MERITAHRSFYVMKSPTISIAVLLALTLGFTVAWPESADARYQPGIRWRTIRGPAVTVYYPAGHEAFARRVASYTSEVTGDVNGYFGVIPPSLPIVLHPGTDVFNGYYSPFPNRISLFETPTPSLRGFGNSLSDLIDLVYTHEYAHYVHITLPGRWTGFAAKIFGNGILVTNILAPGWVLEGITTNLETRFTDGGRGRSAWFRGVMGSFRDNMWSLSAAGSPSPYAPVGGRFYLSGYFMIEYLNRTWGDDSFARFARYQADHPVRAADAALKHVTGLKPEAFYRDFLADFTARDDSVRASTTTDGLPEGTLLWHGDLDGIVSHAWTAEGTISAVRKGYDHPNALLEIDPSSGGVILELPLGRMDNYTPIRFMDDGGLLFGETVYHPLGEGELDTAELVLFDPVQKSREYITHGGHVFSGDRARDGSRYVVARRNGMWSELAIIDAATGAMHTLSGGEGMYVDSPVWSPDGNMIATGMKIGGNTDIALIDPVTGAMWTLFAPDPHGDLDPAWSPDGRWLMFSSDRSGIWNIHAREMATGRVYRLTSVATAAWEPRVSPDGRFLSFLTIERGVGALRIIPFNPAGGREVIVSPGEVLEPAPHKNVAVIDPVTDNSGGIPLLEAYKPFLHAPYIDSGDRGTGAGLYIAGADPVNINIYEADLRYGFESERPGYSLRLINRSFWPVLTARMYDTTETLGGFDPSDDLWRRERGTELYADLPVLHHSVPDLLSGVYRMGMRYRRFSGIGRVRVNPDLNTAFSLFSEVLLERKPDSAARDVVIPGYRALYFTREQHTGMLNANIDGYHTAAIMAAGFASPVRHHGFLAMLAVQQQRGLFLSDKEPYLPRGYDSGDTAGHLNDRKTMLLSLEYRFPISYPDIGVGMGTVHVHRFEGAVFADIGAGWHDSFSMDTWLDRVRSSIGVSAGADVHLLSLLPLMAMLEAGWNPREGEPFIGVRINTGIGGYGSHDLAPHRFFREPRRWPGIN